MNSPLSASVITVPTGTRSTMSSAPRPYWSRAAAVLAALRAVDAREAVVDQRVDVAVGDGVDAAAAAAVAAVGAAARHVLLAAERRDAVAAVAGDHLDGRFVDELHGALLPVEHETLGVVAAALAFPRANASRRQRDRRPSWRPYCTSSVAGSRCRASLLAHRDEAGEIVEQRALRRRRDCGSATQPCAGRCAASSVDHEPVAAARIEVRAARSSSRGPTAASCRRPS